MGCRLLYLVKLVVALLPVLALVACGGTGAAPRAGGQSAPSGPDKIRIGHAKCAHCLPMAYMGDYVKEYPVEVTAFPTGTDVLTAISTGALDVAQITYLHFMRAVEQGTPVIAISGQINGGSDLLLRKDVAVPPDDWAALKQLISDYKARGTKFRIASSRGNAQDIHLRGELARNGIDAVGDVEIVNIVNFADHAAALEKNEVEMSATVEPFASQIRLSGIGVHFAYPYDQPAGNLTNLIVARKEFAERYPEAVTAAVRGVAAINAALEQNPQLWLDVIRKQTGLREEIAREAINNAAPDIRMHKDKMRAIARMMADLKYTSRDVSPELDKAVDYRFLEAATGRKASELGNS